jgi:hypothetical protein
VTGLWAREQNRENQLTNCLETAELQQQRRTGAGTALSLADPVWCAHCAVPGLFQGRLQTRSFDDGHEPGYSSPACNRIRGRTAHGVHVSCLILDHVRRGRAAGALVCKHTSVAVTHDEHHGHTELNARTVTYCAYRYAHKSQGRMLLQALLY